MSARTLPLAIFSNSSFTSLRSNNNNNWSARRALTCVSWKHQGRYDSVEHCAGNFSIQKLKVSFRTHNMRFSNEIRKYDLLCST